MWWWWGPPIVMLVIIFVSLFLMTIGLDEIANPRLRGTAGASCRRRIGRIRKSVPPREGLTDKSRIVLSCLTCRCIMPRPKAMSSP